MEYDSNSKCLENPIIDIIPLTCLTLVTAFWSDCTPCRSWTLSFFLACSFPWGSFLSKQEHWGYISLSKNTVGPIKSWLIAELVVRLVPLGHPCKISCISSLLHVHVAQEVRNWYLNYFSCLLQHCHSNKPPGWVWLPSSIFKTTHTVLLNRNHSSCSRSSL